MLVFQAIGFNPGICFAVALLLCLALLDDQALGGGGVGGAEGDEVGAGGVGREGDGECGGAGFEGEEFAAGGVGEGQ